ncbi:class I SAM-dependent methyltransferase [Polynucleobacter necessarius]|uniref:class I SAM-dependent methyltransferase n=1 Tax=Polynucleobacter necessarius TaxID=576610 RepID=UPI001E637EF4|nr:class I SAM-dependent methyltransferase [Polynucleobacter necessarius]
MTQPIRWLQDEIADRMLQKLDIVKLDVRDILAIPDFHGKHFSTFAKRFPRAIIHSIAEEGVSNFQIRLNKFWANWRALFRCSRAGPLAAYRSSGKINLPDNSVDLVFSDLLLQDLADPKLFLQECRRVLREGGLIVFSYLGPDTGKELRPLQDASFQLKNLVSSWDMHDMGDALMGERFSGPVMDMEYLTLDYEKPELLLTDLEALKLTPPSSMKGAENAVLPQKITLEVVYGHAWAIGKNLAKAQDNIAYIDLNQIGRKTR